MKKKTIGILGPKGSYSDQAGSEYSKDNNKVFFDSINEVILALSSKKIEGAVLPLENSIHGTILETLDGLYNHDLKINKEIILKIDHVLAGVNKKILFLQVRLNTYILILRLLVNVKSIYKRDIQKQSLY